MNGWFGERIKGVGDDILGFVLKRVHRGNVHMDTYWDM